MWETTTAKKTCKVRRERERIRMEEDLKKRGALVLKKKIWGTGQQQENDEGRKVVSRFRYMLIGKRE